MKCWVGVSWLFWLFCELLCSQNLLHGIEYYDHSENNPRKYGGNKRVKGQWTNQSNFYLIKSKGSIANFVSGDKDTQRGNWNNIYDTLFFYSLTDLRHASTSLSIISTALFKILLTWKKNCLLNITLIYTSPYMWWPTHLFIINSQF